MRIGEEDPSAFSILNSQLTQLVSLKMNTDKYPRVFTLAALLVAVVAGLYTALLIYRPVIQPVLDVAPPFVIAIALALLLDPVLDFLQRRGMSRGLGVAVIGLALIVALLLIGFLLVPRIIGQATTLADNFQDNMRDAQGRINEILGAHKPTLERLHLPTTLGEWGTRYSDKLQAAASASLNFLVGTLTSTVSRLLWLIIIPMSTLWLLKDIDYIKAKLIHLTPERRRERLVKVGTAIGVVFGKYIRGMLTVMLLFSLVSMLTLTLFGLHYALIIGAFAGLFYMVPYVGVLILAIITGLTALVQNGSPAYAVGLMVLLFVQASVVFDMLVVPRIVGKSVGVHPVLALFSLALGAQMAGAMGMVLAYPIAASIQVAIGEFYPSIYDKITPKRRGEQTATG